MSFILTPEQIERRRLLFEPCRTKDDLWAWIYTYLETDLGPLDLPDTIVNVRSDDKGSTTTPLSMIWDIYSRLMFPRGGEDDPAEMLFYANREGGKTLCVSVAEVLALLHVRTDVVHLAALVEQSVVAQRYVKKFFLCDDLRGLVKGDNIQETVVVYHEQKAGGGPILFDDEVKLLNEEDRRGYQRIIHRAEIVAASLRATNSRHSGLLVLDELDIIQDSRIIPEAKNIPSPIRRRDGTFSDPLTVFTSTRKTAFGPVQRHIDEADKTGLIVKHFNILEVTERCPESRHRPDLPRLPVYRSDETLRAVDPATYESFDPKKKERYVKDECYTGCLTNCTIFAACRGNLATRPEADNEFVKPLSYVVKKLKNQSLDYIRSQLLCLKPSSVGLIYGHLIEAHHIITPAKCFEMVTGKSPLTGPWMTKAELVEAMHALDVVFGGGQDYGTTHDFAFTAGFKFGMRAFVLRCLAAPDLDPDQKLEYSEPLKALDLQAIYGDTEDPGLIRFFRKHGWRMRDWVKAKGSVKEGILILKHMLAPVGGDPLLYFVVDVTEDEEMAGLIQSMREWSWKLNAAGNPGDIPDEKGKDRPDSLRYWIMNSFPNVRSSGIVLADTPVATVPAPAHQDPMPDRPHDSPFMRDIINGLMGGDRPVITGKVERVKKKGRLTFL